jgi:ribosomal protein S18 acetylase RimI-like enzyme
VAINIRPMTEEDKLSIMQILDNTTEFKPSEIVVAEELIDSYLGAPCRSGYHILVGELNSVVAGYICFGPTALTDATWDIYWMAVAPDKQGQGIGSALLKSAEENIREAEGRLAIIETSSIPAYDKTRQFHIRHGYETVARIPDFYAPGDDKVILRKRLR